MSFESNPYDATQSSGLSPLTLRQKLISLATGGLVGLASAVTMTAFLFGTVVAFAGHSVPSPIDLPTLFASSMRPFLIAGLLAIVPVALLLSVFSTFRVMRVYRNLFEAGLRRIELRQQLDTVRDSYKLSKTKRGDENL